MAQQYQDRIKLLEDQEIDELYGLPRFDHDEQSYYFSLTQEEQDIANSHRTQENRVLFILQVDYFKAKTMFFSFEFNEVRNDVRHILRQYYPCPPISAWLSQFSGKPSMPSNRRFWRCTAIVLATQQSGPA